MFQSNFTYLYSAYTLIIINPTNYENLHEIGITGFLYL